MRIIQSRLAEAHKFSFHSLRSISSPDDVSNGRKIYCGHAPARSFLGLPDNENVREYIVTAQGKKRQRLTDVHRQIRDTLLNRPSDFPILNSGITIVARGIKVNDGDKSVELISPSIINGSQTRGELKHYMNYCKENELLPHNIHSKFEIIVTEDDDLIAEISIARNFQNDVARLSIVGRRKQLDELQNALNIKYPDLVLRKSETERGDDFYDTEKLIQVITALIPAELWLKDKKGQDPRKSYSYAGKSQCLKEFQALHNAYSNPDNADEKNVRQRYLYKFFIDIAPTAYDIYEKWKSHQGFKGTKLRAIERKNGDIVRIPDGILFPIFGALSAFMQKENGVWIYSPPSRFTDDDLILAATSQYMETANSNPTTMGKTQSIYSSLYQLTSIFKRLAS